MGLDYKKEYLRCMMDIDYFANTYCKVWDKGKGKFVPFQLFPTQKRVLDGYKNHDYNLISKYRQGGITTVSCLYFAHLINFSPNNKIAIIANQRNLAEKILSDVHSLIINLPEWLKIGMGKKDANHHKIYGNDSEIQAFSSDPNSVRGASPTVCLLDEAAFLDNPIPLWLSLRGSLSAGGKLILLSTPNGMDSLYWETYKASKEGKNDFNIIELDWYEDPRYNIGLEWRKGENVVKDMNPEKFKEYIKLGFKPWSPWFEEACRGYNYDSKKIAQEIEHKFLGSGGNMIDEEFLMAMEERTVCLPLRSEYIDGNMWIWEDPLPNTKYIISSDVSSGNGEDYSTVTIIKIADGFREQVAEYQGKIPPEVLGREIIDRYGRLYNNATAVVDVSGGVGVPTVSSLLETKYPDIYASNIRAKPIRDRLAKFLVNPDDPEIPGFTISSNRRLILDELTRQIRMDEVIIRSNRMVNEFKTFVWDESKQRFDHTRSTHDDLIFALSMGLYVAQYSLTKTGSNNIERTKAMLSAIVVNNSTTEVDGRYGLRNEMAKQLPIKGNNKGGNYYPPAFYQA